MNRLAFRWSLPVFLLALSSSVYALGLGELRGQPNLGEGLRLEVDILGEVKAGLDVACFRLVQPSGDGDLPWLKKAVFSIRKASPPVLEIRSENPLREPITQISIQIGCGHEIGRDYVLLASPGKEAAIEPTVASLAVRQVAPAGPAPARVVRSRRLPREAGEAPQRLAPRRPEKHSGVPSLPDRLLLSNGIDVGEPSLRLATELLSAVKDSSADAQRDILRLEFRMLLAMNEQATSQLATAEKLRNMEATLSELQQRAGEFSQRVENHAGPGVESVPKPEGGAKASESSGAPPVVAVPPESGSSLSEWSIYGVLLGALLGLSGWFGWRKYQERRLAYREGGGALDLSPELPVDPKRDGEREEPGGVDLAFEPVASGLPMSVDLELDASETPVPRVSPVRHANDSVDSVLSVSATTLDEHFEANPVMELADIMLSFGRVKGAAQALQEYIDNNPQEALQPWIRLMDVYRMAGMRTEFEAVSRNLNQNFNVEVQQWDATAATANSLDLVLDEEAAPTLPSAPVAARPECLEDMPRLMSTVVDLWGSGDVVGYLYQLLRDNRGGQRVGFALPVVEEILFLIELKETSHRMEKELANA